MGRYDASKLSDKMPAVTLNKMENLGEVKPIYFLAWKKTKKKMFNRLFKTYTGMYIIWKNEK